MNTTELEKALIKLIDERIDERFKNLKITVEDETSISNQNVQELLSSLGVPLVKILE